MRDHCSGESGLVAISRVSKLQDSFSGNIINAYDWDEGDSASIREDQGASKGDREPARETRETARETGRQGDREPGRQHD